MPDQAFVAPMMPLDPFKRHAVAAPWHRSGYSTSTLVVSPAHASPLGGFEYGWSPPPYYLSCPLLPLRPPYLHDANPANTNPAWSSFEPNEPRRPPRQPSTPRLWRPPSYPLQVSASCMHAAGILARAPTPPNPGMVGTERGYRAAAAAVGRAQHEDAVAE